MRQGHGDASIVLLLGNDKDAVEAANAVDDSERVVDEVVVVVHVAEVYLDHVVEVAGRVVAFGDLLNLLHLLHEFLSQPLAVLLEPDIAEDDELVAQHAVVYLGYISRDEAFAFQPLLPFEGGRCAQIDAVAEFLGGELGVLL